MKSKNDGWRMVSLTDDVYERLEKRKGWPLRSFNDVVRDLLNKMEAKKK